MDNAKTDQYSKVIDSIELEDIKLRRMSCSTYDYKEGNQLNVNVAADFELEKLDSEYLRATANFTVNVHNQANEEFSLFTIDCSFLLEYKLKTELAEIDKDVIQQFVERNVPVNSWPYAREFISSMTVRMGLPPLVIGTYKIGAF
ncbi:MAG TPA: protein-export chaperone SecB [Bacillota bacterium]|nr:protein-export chaperone SecB [Bacillota bacterium]